MTRPPCGNYVIVREHPSPIIAVELGLNRTPLRVRERAGAVQRRFDLGGDAVLLGLRQRAGVR